MTSRTNAAIDARRIAATPRGVGIGFPIYAERALNAELWDVEGRRYIDFGSGIAVLNTGHRHPRVVEAIRAQLERFTHTAYQVVPYESVVSLAERLNRLTPGTHAKKTAFFTTGAEAVENAIKIARAATRRPGVIALSGGFHGRTFMGMALTGKVVPYKTGFGPFPGSIFHVPAPIALHGVSVDDSLRAIDKLFKADIEPEQVAAIILEPVQGEGGFYAAPPAFMRALREICDRHGILLIADEIQTGFARTGKWFAMDHHDVVPDLMTMAKSLAGGTPLSAVCGRAEIMDAPAPGGLGGTYAANALAIAAAHAVLDVIEGERLCERAQILGDRLKARLEGLRAKVPQIADVRGLGAMVAVEFAGADGAPDPEFTKQVQTRARDAGLLLLTCGVHANVVRFLFPLTIEDAVLGEGLDILAAALQA
ncbi:4-aminobutyrate aminotransferase/4-aminobutyrate aminotransferase/(S)-3-amino-2-methylpropionate transaminase [Variovorax boronicumulans]|uniref:4-aminobutyrate aminotransferase/4-aminobutyrate aminotransferase/(S)-3-amino-2-methylpropionate transaminase n=2 Tax=Variovorax boronicumulans TaxID=436515 RepID=A0AAW8E351_9BURK|nr:4-aminobutyrate--2-oxoglutarate transaminase [Variovorax boronicumulans]MDP9880468.1 4-aminobutyrate aminotransferase/4-aminobutyrate aminotransferase/(S)-3-amino-2-methylpropionate transaminase [Variovorax boronicumulans]MDP9918709.1 4-aminobutyrate aminotransferase/4-aminobutyrate aminotransferase/(S)-3-amino-2-methylpropionate transaminase [Variovorax boronicumulans]MDP9925754.1 4-aminobutyrate aminotransferase/4-aminobutyrate aminotransferase/(S)-3-amino-2-methylpropionate transaminase [V